jgi:hypothetical protein
VILRTPAELVAEYDLPDLDDSASDAEVLAAAAGAEPVKRGGLEVVGEPYVHARVYERSLGRLAEQGRRLMEAESRLGAEKQAARELARKYFAEGRSKREIIDALGVSRPTLDAWLGEGATRPRKRSGS